MDIAATDIPGVYLITPQLRVDPRGTFVKTVHEPTFRDHGLNADFPEQYYSSSVEGVIRGLHFQTPPHEHDKLVTCIVGAVADVALDLRRGSPTYGHHVMATLTAEGAEQIYLPKGVAHGFCALSEQSVVHYNVSTVYAPESDAGVLWSSAAIDWPCNEPLISERDGALPPLADFQSPFVFAG